nr:MAG: nonstructural protein [Microvirus sp.]
MSKKIICTVKDVKAEAYLPPLYVRSKGEAIRSFSDEANNQDTMLGKHPSDYVLFYLGTFCELTGKFELADSPESLGVGTDYVKSST